MQPTKSIAIVLVSLMLTGMVGYFLQPTHEQIDVTRYDYKGDLTPSVLYSQIDDWVEYNPLNNVTGWSFIGDKDDIIYPISENATAYVKDPVIVKYRTPTLAYHPSDEKSSRSYTPFSEYTFIYERQGEVVKSALDTDGSVFYDDSGEAFSVRTNLIYTSTGYNRLIWDVNSQKFYPTVQNERGEWEIVPNTNGYSQSDLYVRDKPALAEGKWTHGSVYYMIPQLSEPVYMDNTKFVEIVGGKTVRWENGQVNGVVNILASKTAKFITSDAGYTSDDPIVSFTKDGIARTLDFNLSGEITEHTVTDGVYTYLLDPGPGPTYYIPTTYHFTDHYGTVWTFYGPQSWAYTNPNTYEVEFYNIYTLNSDDGDSFTIRVDEVFRSSTYITIPQDIPYEYVLCTLDFLNHSFTCRGVTTFENTLSYSVANYNYTLNEVGSMPKSVTTLKVEGMGSDNTKVAIDSTVVSVDPSGILWGNPIVPIQYFFPQQIDGNWRVLFNGFTKYGNTMTINGHTFDIINGELKYDYEEFVGYEKDADGADMLDSPIFVPRTDYYSIKGMAIDFVTYTDNAGATRTTVQLVFTENMDKVINLGELTTAKSIIEIYGNNVEVSDGYTIYATGNWYWQSEMFDIVHTTGDRMGLDLTGNFGLDMTSGALLMIFFIILGSAGLTRLTDFEFVALDWLVIVGSIALLLAVAVI